MRKSFMGNLSMLGRVARSKQIGAEFSPAPIYLPMNLECDKSRSNHGHIKEAPGTPHTDGGGVHLKLFFTPGT